MKLRAGTILPKCYKCCQLSSSFCFHVASHVLYFVQNDSSCTLTSLSAPFSALAVSFSYFCLSFLLWHPWLHFWLVSPFVVRLPWFVVGNKMFPLCFLKPECSEMSVIQFDTWDPPAPRPCVLLLSSQMHSLPPLAIAVFRDTQMAVVSVSVSKKENSLTCPARWNF